MYFTNITGGEPRPQPLGMVQHTHRGEGQPLDSRGTRHALEGTPRRDAIPGQRESAAARRPHRDSQSPIPAEINLFLHCISV